MSKEELHKQTQLYDKLSVCLSLARAIETITEPRDDGEEIDPHWAVSKLLVEELEEARNSIF